MGDPLRVSVVALDPVLQAGATSTLHGSPDLLVVPPDEPARVTVVLVDRVVEHVLDALRAARSTLDAPEMVLVATELEPDEALHAIAAGTRGLLRRRDAGPQRLARAVLAAADGDCTIPPDLLRRLLEYRSGRRPASGAGAIDEGRAALVAIGGAGAAGAERADARIRARAGAGAVVRIGTGGPVQNPAQPGSGTVFGRGPGAVIGFPARVGAAAGTGATTAVLATTATSDTGATTAVLATTAAARTAAPTAGSGAGKGHDARGGAETDSGADPPAGGAAYWTEPGLTQRERAVLSLVADGHETGEIARALCYSPRTVTTIMHDITHRFRLRNRAHAVAYALRAGLL